MVACAYVVNLIANVANEISRVSSVFFQSIETTTVQSVITNGVTKSAIILTSVSSILNVNRITNTVGLEVFNTTALDGYFSGLTIFFTFSPLSMARIVSTDPLLMPRILLEVMAAIWDVSNRLGQSKTASSPERGC